MNLRMAIPSAKSVSPPVRRKPRNQKRARATRTPTRTNARRRRQRLTACDCFFSAVKDGLAKASLSRVRRVKGNRLSAVVGLVERRPEERSHNVGEQTHHFAFGRRHPLLYQDPYFFSRPRRPSLPSPVSFGPRIQLSVPGGSGADLSGTTVTR